MFFPFYFDYRYLLFSLPAVLLALFAQWRVQSAFRKYSRVRNMRDMPGVQVAQHLLRANGLDHVEIQGARRMMGDHYDPSKKVLRLSRDVARTPSVAALGVVAHEVGHAIQDANAYGPLAIRNGLVPMASIGSNFAIILIIVGLVLSYMVGPLGQTLAVVGLGLFGVVVLFQLINLPVEFNASSRAREILLANGMITAAENRVVGKVLNAAALTYVAATATAVLTMLYYASLVFGRRD